MIGNKDNYLIFQVYLIFLDFGTRIAYIFVYLFGNPSHCTGATMELFTGFFLSTPLYLNLGVFINFIGASHYLSQGGPIEKYTTFRKRLTLFIFFITGLNFAILVGLNIYSCSKQTQKRIIYIHGAIKIWDATIMLIVLAGTACTGRTLLKLL